MGRRYTVMAVAVLTSAGMVTAASPMPAPGPMAERPPAGYTGGFGEETCASCHTGSEVNAFGGSVTLEGLTGTYEAGREYVLTVKLEAEGTVTGGFQMAARFEGGAHENAGTLTPLTDRVETSDSAGVTYAHHAPAGVRTVDDSGTSWQVAWRAPIETGVVAFHIAANSGNGDDSPLGDLVFTAVHRVGVEAADRGFVPR